MKKSGNYVSKYGILSVLAQNNRKRRMCLTCTIPVADTGAHIIWGMGDSDDVASSVDILLRVTLSWIYSYIHTYKEKKVEKN